MSSSMLWRLCFMNAYFLMRILVSLIRQSAIIFFIPDCKTVKNEQCIFPFTYKNQVYTGCTSRDHKQKKLWCSTKNKPDGNYETWDDCSKTCPEGEWYMNTVEPLYCGHALERTPLYSGHILKNKWYTLWSFSYYTYLTIEDTKFLYKLCPLQQGSSV